VGRRPDPARRDDLLDTVADLVLERGLHDVALRTLAGELHTSTYTFVYHFGTKQLLVAEALARLSERLEAQLGVLAAAESSAPDHLRAIWRWSIDDDRMRHLRIAVDSASLCRNEPTTYAGYLDAACRSWREALAGAVEHHGIDPARIEATLDVLQAGWFGVATLLLGGLARTDGDAAFEQLVTSTLP
jgi:AcrR family transcriptional regulator